ncbi:hypothetical protein OG709_01300 [Streptomyces sp. NBC_01267]|uniref:hypothetical protein n=1 Tax=unclassified Streptomyces TaxID=2593676 RepID=UPI002023FD11|nr:MULTISPECIES: hypothetical protein [unclassified Streptomyces]
MWRRLAAATLPGRAAARAAELVLSGDEHADEEIRAFNTRTGHDYVALDFAEYDSSRAVVDYAWEAARPARPRIAHVTGRGSLDEAAYRMVRAHIATLRRTPDGAPTRAPSVRLVTGRLTRHPTSLTEQAGSA